MCKILFKKPLIGSTFSICGTRARSVFFRKHKKHHTDVKCTYIQGEHEVFP